MDDLLAHFSGLPALQSPNSESPLPATSPIPSPTSPLTNAPSRDSPLPHTANKAKWSTENQSNTPSSPSASAHPLDLASLREHFRYQGDMGPDPEYALETTSRSGEEAAEDEEPVYIHHFRNHTPQSNKEDLTPRPPRSLLADLAESNGYDTTNTSLQYGSGGYKARGAEAFFSDKDSHMQQSQLRESEEHLTNPMEQKPKDASIDDGNNQAQSCLGNNLSLSRDILTSILQGFHQQDMTRDRVLNVGPYFCKTLWRKMLITFAGTPTGEHTPSGSSIYHAKKCQPRNKSGGTRKRHTATVPFRLSCSRW